MRCGGKNHGRPNEIFSRIAISYFFVVHQTLSQMRIRQKRASTVDIGAIDERHYRLAIS